VGAREAGDVSAARLSDEDVARIAEAVAQWLAQPAPEAPPRRRERPRRAASPEAIERVARKLRRA
jgi:hypothetical protein